MFRARGRKDSGIGERPSTSRARTAGIPAIRRRNRPDLEWLEPRQLLSTYVVSNTNDSGAGSLRQAILDANADATPDNIEFDIPASTAPNLDVPVSGFDPVTQTWRISLASPLPTITNTAWIDGYSQARVGVPFRYPNAVSSATQSVTIMGAVTGGTFTLSTLAPLPVGTTGPIGYNATPAQVQAALAALPGMAGNVAVTGSAGAYTITFQGTYARQALPDLTADASGLTGTSPGVLVQTTVAGGTATADPILISSVPNTVPAKQGNNAKVRVIVDGSATGGATGFVIDSSHSSLRGLIITNFGIGVSVPNPGDVGNLIQGNTIGDYFLYLVDGQTGAPLPDPVAFTGGQGNTQQGVVLYSTNTTVGGSNPQENNVICGNGAQGILIQPGASGNQILGNQIGLAGPSDNGLYSQDGNGAEGVLIQSSGTLADPLNIVYASSNFVGSATGGNLISGNLGAGVRIVGVGANRNLVQGNYIGVAAGGGYLFGTGNPGNLGDGVRIEDGSQNLIGGSSGDLGNVISSNHGAGVTITGPDATTNSIQNNRIGVTAEGSQVLGNAQEGVAIYSPRNTIGPGNVISANLLGVGIYGPTATGIMVADNLIGTDATGQQGFGNANEGVRIDNSAANTIKGNATGSQVISGNQVGVAIVGAGATSNIVVGNLIGSDNTGLKDLGNKGEGVLISGASGNSIGGSLAAAQNLISADHWGVRIDGAGATGNLVARNYIGPDITGTARLGNEVNGIILSGTASGNTIGGAAGLGNRIGFQISSGILAESGVGNTILSNSIDSNGRLGIDLVAPGDPPSGVTPNQPGSRVGPNNLQNYPVLSSVSFNGIVTHIVGTFNGLPSSDFLIQFFTSTTADPSGYGQGGTLLGSTTLTTDSGGNAAIDLKLSVVLPANVVLTATATNQATGDTSEFSAAIPESPAFSFSASTYVGTESSGSAVITVTRTRSSGTSSVQYATVAGGTATPGIDYTTTSGTLTFADGQTSRTFTIPLLITATVGGVKTVNLALSSPSVGTIVDFQPTAVLRVLDDSTGGSGMFIVTNTNDSGAGSLRQAILDANAAPDTNTILFDIPASTVPLLNTPVPGFDPTNQVWTISPQSPLPAITSPVVIDGYTQAEYGVPFRYPNAISSAVQQVNLTGVITGGFFTLGTQSPLPVGTTAPISASATAEQVQAALEGILGIGNVSVSGNAPFYTVTFEGIYARQAVPDLTGNPNGLLGSAPGVSISTTTIGGMAIRDPVLITSTPNSIQAEQGNNAKPRVIIDGSQSGGTGFVIDTSNSILRGLIIDGFDVGVSVPRPVDTGNLIQGNFIGKYFLYPVEPDSGVATTSPGLILVGLGNSTQGIAIDSSNTTIGGNNPQENNVIAGNGGQGIWVQVDAAGNVIEGNQIGMIGPAVNGLYAQVGNGAEGILVNGSSTTIGMPGAGNVISASGLAGIRISGTLATRTIVAANLIGLAPGGGYRFGTAAPGNLGDGVRIEDSSYNQIGGPNSSWTNAISGNGGAGVYITGAAATANAVANNLIGTTSEGTAVKGNAAEGVALYSPGNTIGPGNLISGNLRGVLISGANAAGNTVSGNLIGTDTTGVLDLGNLAEGILIQDATDNVIKGDAKGSQVISGNLLGVAIKGVSATRNLVIGNLIGSDRSGLNPLPNSQEGVSISGSPGNTIGGNLATAMNLISSNHWGVRVDGPGATGNLVAGNYIGTDITGKAGLGSEINGVIVSNSASGNTLGGTAAGAGNVIAYNVLAGISIASGTGNSILSNSIFQNGKLGIDLVAPGDPPSGVTPNQPGVRTGANDLQNYPVLVTAIGGSTSGAIQGTLNSLPSATFVIQFFTNQVPDPSGQGQGQTPIGSLGVTTDSQGNASFSFSPQTALTPNAWVTATATNQATGDTSEFSNAVSALPVSVQFVTSTISVDATDGTILVHVQRVGNGNATVSVNYATANGTAIAGKDYTAASGTLTFQPGEFDKTFPITILANPNQHANSTTVNLALSQPTGGATLGAISTAVLTINENLPPILQFSKSTYSVYSTSKSVLITVTRGGGSRGSTVQVHYATADGTAVAGTDYTSVQGTLTFLPNQLTATFSIPILAGSQAAGAKTVGLVLSSPGGGAQLGTQSTATLSISTSSQAGNPSGPVDTIPPQVIGSQLVLGPNGITGVTFTFSKPLDPTRAADLGNYGYYVIAAGPDAVFGTGDDRSILLTGVQPNAGVTAVTVIPSSPLPYTGFYRIVLDGLSSPLLNRGLADTSGNLLSGKGNGVAGSAFVATFGASSRLTYTDSLGKTVTLTLSNGGLITMFRAPDGDVQSVTLVGATPRKSVLTLRANRAGGRATHLPPIQGAAGVKFRYRSPVSMFKAKPMMRRSR